MQPSTVRARFLLRICSAIFLLSTSPPAEAFVNVFGGPGMDSQGDGYQSPQQFVGSTLVNNSGVAIGVAKKSSNFAPFTERGLRWDGSGSPGSKLPPLNPPFDGISYLYGINAFGTAVGSCVRPSSDADGQLASTVAVRWSPSATTSVELGAISTASIGITHSVANAINNANTVVGYAKKFDPNAEYSEFGERPVRWNSAGVPTELASLGTDVDGRTKSRPFAVNDAGTAVGYAEDYIGSGGTRAIRWDAGGSAATVLGHLEEPTEFYSYSEAHGINAAGTIIGWAQKNDFPRAVRWNAGSTVAIELGNLGVFSDGVVKTTANAINDLGTIVGSAQKFDAGVDVGSRAVRWNPSSTDAVELGNLGTRTNGGASIVANDVNNSDVAVGQAGTYSGNTFVANHATAWKSDNVAIDLNSYIDPASGWVLNTANGISDTGWITGIGTYDPPGFLPAYSRLFLLCVPEFGAEPTSNPGDFNHDGNVDAADYIVWRRDINTADAFSEWRTNFGKNYAATVSTTQIPEPASATFVILSAAAAFLFRASRKPNTCSHPEHSR